MAVAHDRRRDLDAVADAGLRRPAAAVDLRRRRPRSRSARQARSLHGKQSARGAGAVTRRAAPSRRRCPEGGSAPRRTRSSTGSRPPACAGGRCCRSIRPTQFGSPYASASAFAALGRAARRSRAHGSSRARSAPSSSASRPGRADWAAFAGDGAIAEQVRFEREWGALRAYASQRGVRIIGDVPIYVAAERLRPPGTPRAVPPARRGGRGRAARRPQRARPALGQPAVRLGARWRRRATAGGSTGCGARSTSPTCSGSTTSAASPRYWTVAAGAETARDGWWSPGPGAALFRAAEAELGPLPVIAEDLGVITPDVHALRDELGFPGMVVLLWSFGGPRPTTRTGSRTIARTRSSTRPRTTRTRWPASLGTDDVWPLIERALLVALRPGDRPRAGRARARERGAHEPPRRGRAATGSGASSRASSPASTPPACARPPRRAVAPERTPRSVKCYGRRTCPTPAFARATLACESGVEAGGRLGRPGGQERATCALPRGGGSRGNQWFPHATRTESAERCRAGSRARARRRPGGGRRRGRAQARALPRRRSRRRQGARRATR